MLAEADAARGDRLDLLQPEPEPESALAAVEPADELERPGPMAVALSAALPSPASGAVDGSRHVVVAGHPVFGRPVSCVRCSQEDANCPSLASPQGFHLFRHMESNRWVLGLECQDLSPEQLEACATLAEAEFLGERTWHRAGQDVQITVAACETQQEAMDCVAAKAGSILTAEEVTAALERMHAGIPTSHILLDLDPGTPLTDSLWRQTFRPTRRRWLRAAARSSSRLQCSSAGFCSRKRSYRAQFALVSNADCEKNLDLTPGYASYE